MASASNEFHLLQDGNTSIFFSDVEDSILSCNHYEKIINTNVREGALVCVCVWVSVVLWLRDHGTGERPEVEQKVAEIKRGSEMRRRRGS